MCLRLVRVKTFVKDINKLKISDKIYQKFIVFIGKLLSNEPLPKEALDHPLKGNYKDFREFHLSGDLIVIYKIEEDMLKLVRIGSHSQLFEN